MAGIGPVPTPEPWTRVVRRCLPALDTVRAPAHGERPAKPRMQ